MVYKCKNCGKFVAKEASICKHCGQENPVESVQSNIVRRTGLSKGQSEPSKALTIIQCPNCGNQITLQRKYKNEYYLRCDCCNQSFVNPLMKANSSRWVDGRTLGYSNRTWRNAGVFALAIIVFYLLSTMGNNDLQPPTQPFQTDTSVNTSTNNTQVEDETNELVLINGEVVIREAMPKSDYDIISRWREINQGLTSQECRLEKIKRDGRYRIKIGGIYYSCEPRKISNGSNIIFHDANSHNGEFFNLANGTPIYFIPRMVDDGLVNTDGILVIQADGSAQVYMNDYNHQFFELFTELRPLY